MNDREQLSEEDIQSLVEALDRGHERTTKSFVAEVVTSPYVTFSEDTVMQIAENLNVMEGVTAPVVLLDLNTGDLCAAYLVDDTGAAEATAQAANYFYLAAERAGILVDSLEAVHVYTAPELPEEEEEEGGD